MARVYLSIGSNIEPEKYVRGSIAQIRQHFSNVTVSNVYESVAVGFEGENFLNLAVGFDTDMSLQSLAKLLRKIENQNGRKRHREGGYDSRTLDVDILIYGDLAGTFDGIELPRSEIANRGFVILPLADLIPDWEFPAIFSGKLGEFRDRYNSDENPLWAVEFDWQAD